MELSRVEGLFIYLQPLRRQVDKIGERLAPRLLLEVVVAPRLLLEVVGQLPIAQGKLGQEDEQHLPGGVFGL